MSTTDLTTFLKALKERTRRQITTRVDANKISFEERACTGTRVTHRLEVIFFPNNAGMHVSVQNSNGFTLLNVPLDAALHHLSGWAYLSVEKSAAYTDPRTRTALLDIFKSCCGGACWLRLLKFIDHQHRATLERTSFPADVYLKVIEMLTQLKAQG